MKNVSRNKFLLCFRPVVDVDLMIESKAVSVHRSENQALTAYVGVKNKDDMKPSTAVLSSVSDAENSIVVHRPTKKTFSQVVKAVVFEIVLAKRVRERKAIDQRSYSWKHNSKLSKSADKVLSGKGIQDTLSKSESVSSLSSYSSSSSSSPSSSPNSTQKPERQNLQKNDDTCRNYQQERELKTKQEGSSRNNNAIYLLLVSLAVTIFWGKICAILFTSIWLYFVPQQQQSAGVIRNLESIKRSSEKKSRDYYKKKVIMEGLLDRTYNRGALNF
ncbi:hypothetical protein CCACVL1_06795 [Corchorus capsularis]|uniref:Uncharacterized protein n=1 Tax=Corchorus capsularis TaxID=210143 RepID=A0A1R3JCS0_COCAP|nr:hypothetical protein CCACVL1_06795 [Corchorus capsularis]